VIDFGHQKVMKSLPIWSKKGDLLVDKMVTKKCDKNVTKKCDKIVITFLSQFCDHIWWNF
jgi:hypothetical protein